MVAKAMLEKYPGAIVLHNLICSKAVPRSSVKTGGPLWSPGSATRLSKAIMAETGAVFGGEHSGHYYFRDNYRADSGSIAALVVLEVLSKAGVPLVANCASRSTAMPLPARSTRKWSNPRSWSKPSPRILAEHPEAEQSRLDGLTVDLGDWWFNVRPSNTEPLVRLNVEAADTGELRGPHGRGALPDKGAGLTMALDPLLLEILACPQDKGPLLYFPDEAALYNPRLRRRYAINDGIPDMLIDDAEDVTTTSTSG